MEREAIASKRLWYIDGRSGDMEGQWEGMSVSISDTGNLNRFWGREE